MTDITIRCRKRGGEYTALIVAVSYKGLQFLKRNFICTSELVSIRVDNDTSEINSLERNIRDEGLEVEVL